MGRLFEISSGGLKTQFLYHGDRLVAEYNGITGTLLRRYVHGPGADEPLLWYEGSGLNLRRGLFANHQGSIVAVADANGGSLGKNAYDAYGVPEPNNVGRFQYTGQAWLAEFELYYYKARLYSPTLGRFLQTDPIGYADEFNLSAYVGNDPLSNADPTGTTCSTGTRTEGATASECKVADPSAVAQATAGAQTSTVSGPPGVADWATTSGICLGGCHGTSPDGPLRPMTPTEALILDALGVVATLPLGGEFVGAIKAGRAGAHRVFWVGADGQAAAIASGGKLLKPSKAAIDAAARGDFTLMRAQSAAWARGATGEVEVFFGHGKGGTFLYDELPELLKRLESREVARIEIAF
jgi:RHS repeat-associated protein